MSVDNYENHTMLVNLSGNVSNEEWANMVDDMYNCDEDIDMTTDEIVPDDEEVINPKAQKLRLTKLTKYKKYVPVQDLDCDK